MNAQWLCDILLGNFEALRQIQHSRYSIYTHPEPLVPNPQLVQNLLGMYAVTVKELLRSEQLHEGLKILPNISYYLLLPLSSVGYA